MVQGKQSSTKRLADILADMSAYRGAKGDAARFQDIVYSDLIPLAIEATDALTEITAFWREVDGDLLYDDR